MDFKEIKIEPTIKEPEICKIANSKVLIDADTAIVISCYNTESLDEAISNFKALIESIKKYCNSSDLTICVKNALNFRYLIDSEYKAQRKTQHAELKIPFIKELREYLIESYENVLSVPLFEADDLVFCLAKHHKDKGENVIVCSIDKDVLQNIEGTHYNYKKNEWHETSKETATRFKWLQCLSGDFTDGIKGLPKVGLKTAEKMLVSVPNKTEKLKKAVKLLYKTHGFKESYFLKNLRLVSLEQCVLLANGKFALCLED